MTTDSEKDPSTSQGTKQVAFEIAEAEDWQMVDDDPNPLIFKRGPWNRMLLPPDTPVLPRVPEAFRLYSPRDSRWDHEPSASSGTNHGPTPKAARSKATTQKAAPPPVPTPRKEPRWRDG